MGEGETRKCPYCGVPLKHPYKFIYLIQTEEWQHIQSDHPGEYARNETWIQLYKDYSSMGMNNEMSILVISELFNQSTQDVESYLKENNAL